MDITEFAHLINDKILEVLSDPNAYYMAGSKEEEFAFMDGLEWAMSIVDDIKDEVMKNDSRKVQGQ